MTVDHGRFPPATEADGDNPDDLRLVVLNFLVAKRCAVQRSPEHSPWANALEVSTYTGVEERKARSLLRQLATLRHDIRHQPASAHVSRTESWCIVAVRDGLAFLDAWRRASEPPTRGLPRGRHGPHASREP